MRAPDHKVDHPIGTGITVDLDHQGTEIGIEIGTEIETEIGTESLGREADPGEEGNYIYIYCACITM